MLHLQVRIYQYATLIQLSSLLNATYTLQLLYSPGLNVIHV